MKKDMKINTVAVLAANKNTSDHILRIRLLMCHCKDPTQCIKILKVLLVWWILMNNVIWLWLQMCGSIPTGDSQKVYSVAPSPVSKHGCIQHHSISHSSTVNKNHIVEPAVLMGYFVWRWTQLSDLQLTRNNSSSSMVRASDWHSGGCGFDSQLELWNSLQ